SPLRCALVEMTKGRAALPATVVAEQDLVEKHFQDETAENADLSTTLRSGRDDKGEGRASCNCSCGTGPCGKHISKKRSLKTQISPIRCAPVEMTKGRATLPATVVAVQEPFFIALGGLKAHDSSGRKTLPRKGPLTPQISPLRCAPVEMTKGRAALPATVVAEQDPFFIALGGP